MTDPTFLQYLTPAQRQALTCADALLAQAGLPTTAALHALLACARSHVASPAEGHDDVLLAFDLIEQIDYVLAGEPMPGVSGDASRAYH
ncbi:MULTISPECIES: hypothetical protein [Cupriavidus]